MRSGFGSGYNTNSFTIGINEQTRFLRNLFYNGKDKTIKNVLDYIDDISLAYWYMDDGSLNKGDTVRLHTEGFTFEDNMLLKNMFESKWNISPIVTKRRVKYKDEYKEYFYLRFNKEDSLHFFNIVKDYIYESMLYKIPSYITKCEHILSNVRLSYAASYVKSVEYIKHYSSLYDIEVENDHNFFANGTLVHNCQLWRKIGGQIWLCPWMRTGHIGTYQFTGNMGAVAAYTGRL
jgi:hypothetical protein